MNPPLIRIPKYIWNQILNKAKGFSGKYAEEVVFGLFAERRQNKKIPEGYLGNPYNIKEIKEIELKHYGPEIYKYIKQKEKGFYPKSGLRYIDSVEIRNNLDVSNLDAYWFGREQIDIKIFINSKGKFKGWWVNHKTGEFFEFKPLIR